MTELLLCIQELARSPDWPVIKTTLTTTITVGRQEVAVTLVRQRSPIAELLRFLCPSCGRRCRDLFALDGVPGCRRCLQVRHPDQKLSASAWDRGVVLPALQIHRIEERLRNPMPWNSRRRLVRRRARLLRQVELALAARRDQTAQRMVAVSGLS